MYSKLTSYDTDCCPVVFGAFSGVISYVQKCKQNNGHYLGEGCNNLLF